MTKKATLLTVLLALLAFESSKAQSIDFLRQRIDSLLEDKSAMVGVAVRGTNSQDTISINGDTRLPMQSIFKYHLALAVLHQIDQGEFSLEQVISLDKELMDSYKHLWSLLRKRYPEGGDVSLREILTLTVANSDNVGCDVLYKLIGGPAVVENYMHQMGIADIAIKYNELTMQTVWEYQYENWTTAKATNTTLMTFFENSHQQLTKKSYDFLWGTMKQSWHPKVSMKSFLPENTIIAHKTGHSGKNDKGITAAQNDIGIIFLPDGTYFYLSVLVSDSKEEANVNKKIIADITKLCWDYFSKE
ncbi:MAG: class A beta-lactamase [Crocinitomicaceae bacterium]